MSKFLAILLGLAASGAAHAQGAPRPAQVGDVHVYAAQLKAERASYDETVTITAIEGGRIRTRHARSDKPQPAEGLYGADWSILQSGSSGVRMEPASRLLALPLEVGKTWEANYQATTPTGFVSRLKMESTVAAREPLATPAGRFDTFRIDSRGYLSGVSWQGGWGVQQKLWYAPAIDRIVRLEYREQRSLGADNVIELKAFQPAN